MHNAIVKSEKEEREKKHFEKLASKEGYAWWGSQTDAAKFRVIRRIDLVKEYLDVKPGKKILECGCGSGDFTSYLVNSLDNAVNIYAIDISSSQLKLASKKIQKSNVNFVTGSVMDLPFKNEFFDFVIGNAVLHHLDIDKSLEEIKRVLKPGGSLLFFEPNMLNPQVWLSLNIKPLRKLNQASEDETAFYKWRIKKILTSFNFKNISVKPFDFMHPLIPKSFLNLARVVESILEKTFINEIAGSLIVAAES